MWPLVVTAKLHDGSHIHLGSPMPCQLKQKVSLGVVVGLLCWYF